MAINGKTLTKPLPVFSWWFATEALQRTQKLLDELESATFFGHKVEIFSCIGLWFWSLESAVSTAFKLIAPEKAQSEIRRLEKKFEKLPSFLGSAEKPSHQQFNELRNFCTFRNQLFHDLYYPTKQTEYVHTNFSRVPAYANEIDLLESMRICTNSMNYYRDIISGVDLLPKYPRGDLLQIFESEIVVKFNETLRRKGFNPVSFREFDKDICLTRSKEVYAPLIRFEAARFEKPS